MIFGWDGKVHRITGYTDRTTYATISIVDVNDINANPNWHRSTQFSIQIKSKCKLESKPIPGETGTLTAPSATCRATGHDS